MTIASSFKSMFQAEPVSVSGNAGAARPKLKAKLEMARADLAEHEARHDQLSFDVTTGVEGADELLAAWEQQHTEKLQTIAHLEASIRHAEKSDKDRAHQRAADQRKKTIAELKRLTGEQLQLIGRMQNAIGNMSDDYHAFGQLTRKLIDTAGDAGLPIAEIAPYFVAVNPRTFRNLLNIEFLRANRTPQSDDGIFHTALPAVNLALRSLHQLSVELGDADLDPNSGRSYSDLVDMRERYRKQRDWVIQALENQPLPGDEIMPPENDRVVLPPQEQQASDLPLPPRPTAHYYVPPSGETERPINLGGGIPSIPDQVVLPADAADARVVAIAQFAERVAAGQAPEEYLQQIEKKDPELAMLLREKQRRATAKASDAANRINDLMRGDTL